MDGDARHRRLARVEPRAPALDVDGTVGEDACARLLEHAAAARVGARPDGDADVADRQLVADEVGDEQVDLDVRCERDQQVGLVGVRGTQRVGVQRVADPCPEAGRPGGTDVVLVDVDQPHVAVTSDHARHGTCERSRADDGDPAA